MGDFEWCLFMVILYLIAIILVLLLILSRVV